MPPSGRKGKTRVRRAPAVEHHEPSDAETPEAITTPSRGSRKRGRATDAPVPAPRNTRRKVKDTRSIDREDTEGTELQDQSDGETEPSPPTEQEIIQSLRVADKHVNATEDFANDLLEGQENVPGYGKIAGRDWVFIIRKIEINLGRPEAHERLTAEENGHVSTPTAKTVVDIDLGPDRQVSRLHAVISYDSDSMQWFIVVNGRNGLRVDNNLHKRGTKTYLRNGSVIEIANTQMAFITTSTGEDDGPIWDASIIRQAQKSSEEDDDGEDDARTNNPRPNGTGASRSQMQNTSVYQSDYNGQQQQQQRMHPHSQRASLQAMPGTPTRNQQQYAKSSPAANYSRGVMMESTESIDYSADSAKDLKPPHSYAQLIGMAILSTQEQQMTLNNIYKWIMANYAFYRFNTGGWQNSIRHNLSLNKAFTKIARRTDEPGKGMKWMIEPTEFDNFVQQGMKGCRRPNPLPATQSTLGSPTSPVNMIRGAMRKEEDATPPMNPFHPSYPSALEAYTPERGSRRNINGPHEGNIGLGINRDGLVDYEYPQRATPRRGLNAAANAAGSPPALYVNDEGRMGPLDTPFPLRPTQRLAPPSTLRRPSDFIQFSSPAPFWKMDGLVGSTPFKPLDLSPLKTPFPAWNKGADETKADEKADSATEEKTDKTDQSAKDDEPKSKGSPILSSSSPPRPNSAGQALDASPTVSRPASAVAKTLSQLVSASKEPALAAQTSSSNDTKSTAEPSPTIAATASRTQSVPVTTTTSSNPALATSSIFAPQTTISTSQSPINGFPSIAAPPKYSSAYTTTSNSHSNGFHTTDDEDEGIDLVKYISSAPFYHHPFPFPPPPYLPYGYNRR